MAQRRRVDKAAYDGADSWSAPVGDGSTGTVNACRARTGETISPIDE